MERMWQMLEGPSSGGAFTPEAVILSLLLALLWDKYWRGCIILLTAVCLIQGPSYSH